MSSPSKKKKMEEKNGNRRKAIAPSTMRHTVTDVGSRDGPRPATAGQLAKGPVWHRAEQ